MTTSATVSRGSKLACEWKYLIECCPAASVRENNSAANATFADCPDLQGYLYFADSEVDGTLVHKGSLVVFSEKEESPVAAVDLGVQADCSVGQKKGKSEFSRACKQ